MGCLALLFSIILCLLLEFPSFSFSSSNFSSCLPNQSLALLQFKASFTIDMNSTTDNAYAYRCNDEADAYLKTTTWENGTDCCSWLGVTCNPVSGHVIGLDLTCGGLQGKIHPNSTLFHLTHLQTLNLAFNDFSNSELSSHFGGLVSLTHLNLSGCDLEGEIPSQISHLSKLVTLDLSDNEIKWKETTWSRLVQNTTTLKELVLDLTDMSSIRLLNMSSSLVTLSLAYTRLKGNLPDVIFCLIPPTYSNLSHLTSLTLSDNNLNGSIPSSLLTLPSLTSLDLHWNHLSGQLPDVFPQSNRFQKLDLSDNNIEGVLPSSLSNLHNLILLDLSSNKFGGQIPDVFGGVIKLKTLKLQQNNFRGQIPYSLFGLPQLSHLDCSYNKLEGPFPIKITGCSNLTTLRLNNNLLNGTIPSWCLSFPSLEELDLSNNQFIGNISATSSYSLKSLYLFDNKLEGNIPELIFNLANLSSLDLSSNNLSGHLNFQIFSKLQSLEELSLSHNSQLSLNFKSNVNYSFSYLKILKLSSLSLNELPKLSKKFPVLSHLDLSNNQLNGRVPNNWLQGMGSLQFLNLSQNLLTSSVGIFIGRYMLSYLDLSFNLLVDDISLLICNGSSLQILKLSHNKFTGTVPQCLGTLPYLQVLDMHMNKLHGTFPSNFSKKNELRSLNLNGNQLEGSLPKSLSHCTKLEFLDLGNNQIEGTFPHWLETLPYLEVLVLRENKFDGSIASTKARHPFPSLMIFDISCNNFSGPIPNAYIENWQAMKNVFVPDEGDGSLQYMELLLGGQYDRNGYVDTFSVMLTIKENNIDLSKIPTIFAHIDLSKNIFEGEIPDVIRELHALKGLNLSHNRLTGPIPRSMGNLTNLESLDISSNMITGGIPAELTNMNSLEVLNLSCNHLEGEIPQGKQFNTFSNDSYEENLGLCGFPLSKKCHVNPEPPSPPSPILWEKEKFEFGWKPVAIGYGCGMVFGVGLGCCVFSMGKPQWLVRMFGGHLNKKAKRRTRRRTHGTMNQLVQMS